ncbi:MAG: argininosuccinate lyase [Candidatus Thermofonsia Clade 1 bacterium]|uniref:Argininosuccinate lyase n=4 Tax=Candidatus Thermofonsia Clade 1 bacterium TaxID=2364210 RepID=A0A2M8Q0B6_9CHLR|nr:MAG: argininosuccinate lyase [Candidatus Thermofonsia Clade 1 bacterium]
MSDSEASSRTLWSGRYEQAAAEAVRKLNDSLSFDQRLYASDIACSIAYAQALHKAGVLNDAEIALIVSGLQQVRAEFDSGAFQFAAGDEDIHTAVERRLTELIGAVGGKLHTGRSRNDQVATDTRHWQAQAISRIVRWLTALQRALLEQAKPHVLTLMVGYTHLRAAQPISAAHWLLSYFWMLSRDVRRFELTREATLVCPLGSGALAGTPYALDRHALAESLGFLDVSPNSLDAVSDRDFVVGFLYAAALLMTHLSRFAEDVILFSGPPFAFIQLDERYTTGSSLMPQKQNPDVLELTRGKAGRLIGRLAGLLTTLKGLPTGYNKDLQEDKEALFDAADTLETILPALIGTVESMRLQPEAMRAALDESMLATDLADYLVGRGVPFREAHRLVGAAVRAAQAQGVPLSGLPLQAYQAISAHFQADLYSVFDFSAALAKRSAFGGTGPEAVRQQIERAEAFLQERGA